MTFYDSVGWSFVIILYHSETNRYAVEPQPGVQKFDERYVGCRGMNKTYSKTSKFKEQKGGNVP